MHLVLRSTKAKGDWSFRTLSNQRMIKEIIAKFSRKYGVKIHSMANVGNHLHFQIRLGNRFGYFAFIRAITGAIALKVAGSHRKKDGSARGFWDHRPFTRVVKGLIGFLNLRDYITLNEIEGFKNSRVEARMILERIKEKEFFSMRTQ